MKFQVIGKNIELTDAIKGHLDNKINKIFPNADESTGARISLCVEKHRLIAHVTIKTNGVTLHACDETEDLYTSMDSVLKKIEKHLKKHKARAHDLKIKSGFETRKMSAD
jgi:putative sigma-54 modulation protein